MRSAGCSGGSALADHESQKHPGLFQPGTGGRSVALTQLQAP